MIHVTFLFQTWKGKIGARLIIGTQSWNWLQNLPLKLILGTSEREDDFEESGFWK